MPPRSRGPVGLVWNLAAPSSTVWDFSPVAPRRAPAGTKPRLDLYPQYLGASKQKPTTLGAFLPPPKPSLAPVSPAPRPGANPSRELPARSPPADSLLP